MRTPTHQPHLLDTSGHNRFLVLNLEPKPSWQDERDLNELCLQYLGCGHRGSYGAAVVAKAKSMRDHLWSNTKALWERHGTDFLHMPAEPQTSASAAE